MNILGIESSCDETAASVVKDGRILLSNVVESQIDIHAKYGGVVPEIASRSHLEAILPVVNQALETAFLLANEGNEKSLLTDNSSRLSALSSRDNWQNIDAVAVTYGPGLSGGLLMGSLTARTLARVHNKPIIGVNHVLAHVYANWLSEKQPNFPLLALIVSGGHSQIALFKSHSDYKLLGQTRDDAVGEAFDKVAKMLGMKYPGGPRVSAAAKNGDPLKYRLPKARMSEKYDFSFSGLKTAVLRTLQSEVGKGYDFPSFQISELLTDQQINDVSASFQKAAIETLVDKLKLAVDEFSPESVVIAGGVAANSYLRDMIHNRISATIDYAPANLCTDNAAMIATAAFYQSDEGKKLDDPLNLKINSSLSMYSQTQ
ncbi:tRNA (adenosine(37)-N6)-threonylcarbamoyltransferase complex transferase subunit TsaD [Candidatus Saccharibacteria bacterium]|nr:tRNA (adenosine(37)-N6)-threonylcarbamoyltransferase complex transferase subunit TsaD [Candidatus Saccharibacteria bacterium]MBP9132283.1 tRNA (adenosine(37)-N6)-threonylcarbamoyltransferase complex transferase subunit TsaD [Candidatus Saccharibacteria bacterium]